ERPERGGRRMAVQPAQRPQGVAEVVGLPRRRPVRVAVVLLRVVPEGEDQLADGQLGRGWGGDGLVGSWLGVGKAAAVGEPFGEDALVLDPALGTVPLPEVYGRPPEDNDSLAGRLVEAVRGDAGFTSHGAAFPWGK